MAVKTAVELDSSGVSCFCLMLRYPTKAAEGRKGLFDSYLLGMAWWQEWAAAHTVFAVRLQRDECL